jgi:DNA-binding NarL/FixJ family response regulator
MTAASGGGPGLADSTGAVLGVLLVDDQPLARAGLARILEPEDDMTIAGECSDGDEVVAQVDLLDPDVVVMDMRMKRVDGAEAIRRLAAHSATPPPVLVLTTFDDDETLADALAAGAAGFVLKDAPGEDIVRAVRSVGRGGAWLDPQVTRRVLETYRTTSLPRAVAAAQIDELTDREREVLVLMAKGCSNGEIAGALFIGEGTVKTHVGHILAKVGLRDRAAAIVFAFDHGLVSPRGEAADPPTRR